MATRAQRREAPKLYYTDGEIRQMYRQAKHPQRQIRILAELNCSSSREIEAIIFEEESAEMEHTTPDYSVMDEYDRMKVVVELARETDTDAVAQAGRQLVLALAGQAADKTIARAEGRRTIPGPATEDPGAPSKKRGRPNRQSADSEGPPVNEVSN